MSLVAVAPRLARAEGDDRPLKLSVTAAAGGPVGMVESFGSLAVDGQMSYGRRALWGGELLQATGDSVSVTLDRAGRVTLLRGAAARLRVAPTTLDDGAAGVALVASVLSGEIRVTLRGDAEAYVEAGDASYVATRGAAFRVGIRDGVAMAAATGGAVRPVTPGRQGEVRLRPVRSLEINTKARGSQLLEVRVTDENDRPVPDGVPVTFALSQAVGSFTGGGTTVTVNTVNGVASTTFTAGPAKASATLTVSAPGAQPITAPANISTPGLSTAAKVGIAAAAAAAAGVGIYAGNRNGDNDQGRVESGDTRVRP